MSTAPRGTAGVGGDPDARDVPVAGMPRDEFVDEVDAARSAERWRNITWFGRALVAIVFMPVSLVVVGPAWGAQAELTRVGPAAASTLVETMVFALVVSLVAAPIGIIGIYAATRVLARWLGEGPLTGLLCIVLAAELAIGPVVLPYLLRGQQVSNLGWAASLVVTALWMWPPIAQARRSLSRS